MGLSRTDSVAALGAPVATCCTSGGRPGMVRRETMPSSSICRVDQARELL